MRRSSPARHATSLSDEKVRRSRACAPPPCTERRAGLGTREQRDTTPQVSIELLREVVGTHGAARRSATDEQSATVIIAASMNARVRNFTRPTPVASTTRLRRRKRITVGWLLSTRSIEIHLACSFSHMSSSVSSCAFRCNAIFLLADAQQPG